MKLSIGVLVFTMSFVFLISPVHAAFGTNCTGGNLMQNITDISDHTEWVWIDSCPNGCVQVEGGFQCAATSFYIPMEIFIIFQVAALILMLIMIFNFRTDENSGIALPVLSFIFFAVVSYMSFNISGTTFIIGGIFNSGLALLSMIYIFVTAVETVRR